MIIPTYRLIIKVSGTMPDGTAYQPEWRTVDVQSQELHDVLVRGIGSYSQGSVVGAYRLLLAEQP